MRKLMVNLKDRSYPIYIEKGLIDSIGEEIKKIYNNKKIAVITDSNVDRLYGKRLENSLIKENFITKKIIIEPGENSKSFDVLEEICDELLEFGMGRTDLIITFGGGVVGDLGGFAASILLRGVQFVQIPTSLLSQIDSSIGGKVAIDTKRGKNLIGSFYQPVSVFIDPDLLYTLDDRFLYDGMAEVIKYGAIKDRELFYRLLGYDTKKDLLSNIEEVIYTCCSIKKDIVEVDEKDTGKRMLLNFGHTIGHAVEKYFNYQKFTHGEAVAIGMCAITGASEERGETKKGTLDLLRRAIIKYNLPHELPDMEREKVLEAVRLDKKNSGDFINIVLLESIGSGFIKRVEAMHMDGYLKI